MSERKNKIQRNISEDRFKAGDLHIANSPFREVVGNSMEPYMGALKKKYRKYRFEVVPGEHYVKVEEGVYGFAIRLLVPPDIRKHELRKLAGMIPEEIPKYIPVVYKKWDHLARIRPEKRKRTAIATQKRELAMVAA